MKPYYPTNRNAHEVNATQASMSDLSKQNEGIRFGQEIEWKGLALSQFQYMRAVDVRIGL